MCSTRSSFIDLWSLGESGENCSLALRVKLNQSAFLHCTALSDDGSLLCTASEENVRLWSVNYSNPSLTPELNSVKIQKFIPKDSYVQALTFGGPGMSVALSNGSILVLDIKTNGHFSANANTVTPKTDENLDDSGISGSDNDRNNSHSSDSEDDDKENIDEEDENGVIEPYTVSVRHAFNHRDLIGDHKLHDASMMSNEKDNSSSSSKDKKIKVYSALRGAVRSLVFSGDGSYLAVASAAYSFFIYDLDRLRLHWQPSDLPAAISCISFHPSSPNILVVLLANNMFLSFDMDTRDLTEWSRNNTQHIPAAVLNLPRPLEALTFDPTNPSVFFAYGQNTSVYMI